jgi:hypothetical protein
MDLALHEKALESCQRLHQKLHKQQLNDAPSDHPAIDPHLSHTSVPSGTSSDVISTSSTTIKFPNKPDAASIPTLTTSTNQAAIPTWMTKALKQLERVFSAPSHSPVIDL